MSDNLFQDFNPASLDQWLQKIKKDLKGTDVSALESQTPDQITIKPAYHEPGKAFAEQPFRQSSEWKIVQEIMVMDASQANKQALENLNRGATSLLFYILPGCDLEILLHNILIEHVAIHLVTEGNGLEVWQKLQKIINQRGIDPGSVEGSINIDCLENLARTGNWFRNEVEDLEEIKKLNYQLSKNFRGICINANLFGNAGATLAQQSGIALAMAYEYIHRLELQNADKFWFNFAIGSDYFGEIARLRAFRRLWYNLQKELGLEPEPAHIYAETALRNKTIKDGYNNMIRTTAEAMAAATGGCDELSVKGFDITFREPTPFGERIAKNQQSVLEYESHFNKVRDISRGSYFIEELTDKIAEKSWDFFKEIETEGGFLESLKKGWLQAKIETAAAKEQKAFDEKQNVLIGANKYAREDENLKETIEYGMFFRENTKQVVVKPLKVKRLSEELEKEPS